MPIRSLVAEAKRLELAVRYRVSIHTRLLAAVGFLKFFDPFRTWFHIQIAKGGLPPLAVPLGMAAEISIGLGLLLASSFRHRIRNLFAPIIASASAGLVVNMAVAIYVHLQPDVPANVLPLGIKPPFIPLAFMLLAGLNLFQLLHNRPLAIWSRRPARRS